MTSSKSMVFCVVCMASALAALAQQAPRGEKTMPPSLKDQEASRTLIREVYRADFASANSGPKSAALAKKLHGLATQTTDDVSARFVLLDEARRLAVVGESLETASAAINHIDAEFDVDVLTLWVTTLEAVTQAASQPAQYRRIAEGAVSAARLAVERERFETAERLANIGLAAAVKAKDAEREDEVNTLLALVKFGNAHGAKVASARVTLKTAPADPAANASVGKFLCFVKGDWATGLPLLALGDEAKLAELAKAEIVAQRPVLQVADGWWDIGQGEENVGIKQNILDHSGQMYRVLLPTATGLTKAKLDQRVNALPKPIPSTGIGVSRPTTGPKPLSAPFDNTAAAAAQAEWAAKLDASVEETNTLGMKLVLIPPGEFAMGAPATEVDAQALEQPAHAVRITRPFFMGRFEVTRGQWERFATESKTPDKGWKTPGFPQTDLHPVVKVSWEDATRFCIWLSAKEKKTYRLPTEAEWEYACRAGTSTRYSFGDNAADLGGYAWFDLNSGRKTHPVGEKQPNAFGLYDMHGNVWEWCGDWFGDGYKQAQPLSLDPQGPANGAERTRRGGSWFFTGDLCRSAYRYGSLPTLRGDSLGFRVVRIP